MRKWSPNTKAISIAIVPVALALSVFVLPASKRACYWQLKTLEEGVRSVRQIRDKIETMVK